MVNYMVNNALQKPKQWVEKGKITLPQMGPRQGGLLPGCLITSCDYQRMPAKARADSLRLDMELTL